ncbi:MAG: M20/M25/M40 family metallo-hydrolase [Legionella sp.]|nr:M20/M25/M40 family metallo-hydrolase [Legionella sp.]
MKTRQLFLLLSMMSVLLLHHANAAPLSTVEKKITLFISQQKSKQLSLLEQLVNINSGTNNLSGTHQVGKILQAQFDLIGFKTRWIEMPADMHRAPTLIAEHQGTAGKKLLLIGHLDTVFSKNSAFKKFEQHGNFATGPGVIDDKGGDVVMLYALKALHAAQALQNTSITVILTGDEEDSGKPTSIARKPLFDAAKQSDIALDFEFALTADTATIARRGATRWTLHTKGNEAHSSKIFQDSVGDGAIFEMTRILSTMQQTLKAEKYLSFNPGLILGGTKVAYNKNNSKGHTLGKDNVVAQDAMATGDLRFLSPKQKIKAEEQILSIIQKHLPGTTASIQFEDAVPAMPPTADNLKLLKQYSDVSQDLGYGSIQSFDPGLRGAGDISYIATLVSANLAGIGALGSGAHSLKETLDINSLPIQTERAALLIYRLTHE